MLMAFASIYGGRGRPRAAHTPRASAQVPIDKTIALNIDVAYA